VVKLVLFDVDGTLIRTQGAGIKAFERTFASEFKLSGATDGVEFAGRTDPSIVREVFDQCKIEPSPENFKRFFGTYVFWLDHLLSKTNGGICVGVWNFINGLMSMPVPPMLGLLTGNIRLGAEIKLRYFHLWEQFQTGAFGDDDENRDHLAGLAQKRASSKLGAALSGSEILVVGDTPLDIQCARAIQAKVIAVGTGGYTLDELKPFKADWLVANLSEVNATAVCGA
jgi:phosphoglycolate phosphatase-like HAD superfamily hydrolase